MLSAAHSVVAGWTIRPPAIDVRLFATGKSVIAGGDDAGIVMTGGVRVVAVVVVDTTVGWAHLDVHISLG